MKTNDPIMVSRGGRDHWLFPQTGKTIPVVRGGDSTAVLTLEDLTNERGRIATRMQDLTETAKKHNNGKVLFKGYDNCEAERAEFDECADKFTDLNAKIEAANADLTDAKRGEFLEHARSVSVPRPKLVDGDPLTANRSLDEVLWATQDEVAAGSFDKTGRFTPHHGARNQVEQITVRSETMGGGEMFLPAPRITEFRPEHQITVRSFQNLVSDMCLFGMMIDKQSKSSAHGFEVARSHARFKERWNRAMRAMDVDTSAEGGTWVPTGIGGSMHEKVRAAGKVAALFSRIDLPTNPWKWPIEGADATAYRVGEPTTDSESKMSASTPGTVAATYDAEIFGARALVSRALEPDSALAILPFVKMKLIQAFVDGEEKAIIDGDTDGTHMDSDIGASTTATVTAWDGLRKRALANASVAATTMSVANLMLTRKQMGKWGVAPSALAYIVGVSNYHTLLTDSNLLTVDKMGPQATILNGMIGSVGGVPVIVSEWMRETLNASGVYDGITTTKTHMLCVNRNEWVMGQRMALDVEIDDSIYRETYQRVLVGFMREDFQNIGDASSNKDTAIGYNTTP